MAASQPALQLRPGTAWVPRPGLCLYPCRHAAGRRLASGFSRARPAGRPWEGHSPPASHPAQGRPEGRPWARRPWWLQDPRWSCHQCSGPSPCIPKKRVPPGEAAGQENPASGVPGPLRIEGPGDWLAGVEPSKGVLSSAPTPVGVGRTTSAGCRQQLAQTRAQATRWLPPCPPAALSTLPTSWVKRLAGASGSCCPLQVT